MTVGGHRSERIAEEVRHEVSLMLAGELKDPRLAAPLDVTEVRMSPDLRTARVYVRIQGEETERDQTLAGLRAAAGFIRHELVERLQLRRAPDVIFVADESEEYGQHIDELLRKSSHHGPDKPEQP
jgi:ribosome-binding factor A